ncbi:MAG: ketopantoate reductase family protein [Methanophagales archaeon ANME-1-THS]|nr:MAG: ketopantoate reductase family protein [Methanophagales archaeon ANME-1-THS]
MHILVYGAGAIGSLVGALLSKEHEVILLGRKEHMQAIRKDGLRVTGLTRMHIYLETTTTLGEVNGKIDLVILTVKSYDTHSAANELAKNLKPSQLLSIQNGLNNANILERYLGKTRLVFGTTSQGVTFVKPGEVRHAGLGRTVVGCMRNEDFETATQVCDLLSSCGLKTELTDNIIGEIWAKAIVNACINPLTVILRCENGRLLGLPEVMSVMKKCSDECEAVAKAKGIMLPTPDMYRYTVDVASQTASNHSSMLQDIEKGKPTEINGITGVIVSAGKKFKVQTPVNFTLLQLVKGIEALNKKVHNAFDCNQSATNVKSYFS